MRHTDLQVLGHRTVVVLNFITQAVSELHNTRLRHPGEPRGRITPLRCQSVYSGFTKAPMVPSLWGKLLAVHSPSQRERQIGECVAQPLCKSLSVHVANANLPSKEPLKHGCQSCMYASIPAAQVIDGLCPTSRWCQLCLAGTHK
jgi:hypothetical protein